MSDTISYVGRLAGGKRVYVRDKAGEPPLRFAIYADVDGDGGRRLVGRTRAEPPRRPTTSGEMVCENGLEHLPGACCWRPFAGTMSAEDRAGWSRHWWTHVARKDAEVVAVVPVRSVG